MIIKDNKISKKIVKYTGPSIAATVIITFLFSIFFNNLIFIRKVCSGQLNPGRMNLLAGIRRYEEGKYNDAISILKMAVKKIPDNEKENLWNAHFYIALSFHLLRDDKEAHKVIKEAYNILSGYRPDTDLYSQKTIKWFNHEMNKIKKAQIKEIIAIKNPPRPDDTAPKPPFYKKWWFWTIVAGLAGGGTYMAVGKNGGGGGGDDTVIISW